MTNTQPDQPQIIRAISTSTEIIVTASSQNANSDVPAKLAALTDPTVRQPLSRGHASRDAICRTQDRQRWLTLHLQRVLELLQAKRATPMEYCDGAWRESTHPC